MQGTVTYYPGIRAPGHRSRQVYRLAISKSGQYAFESKKIAPRQVRAGDVRQPQLLWVLTAISSLLTCINQVTTVSTSFLV